MGEGNIQINANGALSDIQLYRQRGAVVHLTSHTLYFYLCFIFFQLVLCKFLQYNIYIDIGRSSILNPPKSKTTVKHFTCQIYDRQLCIW